MTNLTQRHPKNIFKRMEARTRCPPRRVKSSKRARQTNNSEYSNLSKNTCQHHHKIAPKIMKNPSKIDPWTLPGTLLDQRSLLRPLISPFLAPKGSPMGPQNWSKIDHFLDLFLNDFWKSLFHTFCLHLGSQNDPKMRPKRELRPKHEKHRFCYYLLHFSHIQGSWISAFLVLFWDSF